VITPPTQPPASGNVPQQLSVGTSMAWVEPTSHRTLYALDIDTATGTACTSGCLNIWPPLTPSTGSAATGNMTIITRADGTGKQWAYQGHPLYTYSGDSGAQQANGEGIPEGATGHWHVARPAGSTGGGGGGGGCTGIYC
jgi:predicted lipoprotein with Yx(FWY)xxD motif